MIVIDRIEGKIAVLEVAGRLIDFPAEALPAGLKEGDRLELRLAAAQAFWRWPPPLTAPTPLRFSTPSKRNFPKALRRLISKEYTCVGSLQSC